MINEVLQGDCLNVLKKLKASSVDLAYLDPPFFTQKKHTLRNRENTKTYSFDDSWSSIETYRNYIKERLIECRRTLKPTGSIFLHCDKAASHHLRVALDEVFGASNFQSEIIWSYRRWSNSKKGLLNSHQVIFFYSKTSDFKFNQMYSAYSPTTNIDQIFQKRVRDENGKTKYKIGEMGGAELIDNKTGVPLSDVWEIPYLNPKAKERVGYPTQKPILLLEQIIKLASDEDDVILDPFCGSGTTLVAAKLLNRQYVGIDVSEEAVSLTKERLVNPVKSESNLLKSGKDSYKNQSDEILSILVEIDAEPVQRNKGIDGFLKIDGKMKPIPVRVQRENETFDNAKRLLLKAIGKNGFKRAVLLKTNDSSELSLFDEPENEADTLIIIDNLDLLPAIRRELGAMA